MSRIAPLVLACGLVLGAASHLEAQDTTHVRTDSTLKPATPAAAPVRVRRDPELITADELQRSQSANLLRAITQLRSQWLRTRAVGGGAPQATGAAARAPGALNAEQTETVVYLDRVRFGGRLSLEQIQTLQVDSVRFIPGSQAVRRWGASHREGAVMVYTRR